MSVPVPLSIPNSSKPTSTTATTPSTFLTDQEASFLPSSVIKEITRTGKLPVAPSSEIIEAAVLLADISGFSKLSEKLQLEHGDERGTEMFVKVVGDAFAVCVRIIERFGGEVVKFAGDCLICIFTGNNEEEEEDDEDDFEYFSRAKMAARALLDAIVTSSDGKLDLHGGLVSGNLQRIHLKDLRSGSPRTKSARQRLHDADESTLTTAQIEQRKSRWFCIAGRPLKQVGKLLDQAPAGEIHVGRGEVIDRTTPLNGNTTGPRRSSLGLGASKFEIKKCPSSARCYIPPIVRQKFKDSKIRIDDFSTEHRNVIVTFISLPGLFKASSKAKGVDCAVLNDTYSALLGICAKHDGVLRDFLVSGWWWWWWWWW